MGLDNQCLEIDPSLWISATLFFNCVFSFIYLFLAFDVSHTANMGLVVITCSIVFLTHSVLGFLASSLQFFKTPLWVGITLGDGIICVFLSIQSSIFWGNLSVCQSNVSTIIGYSCSQKVAYRLICIISMVLAFLQLLFSWILYNYRKFILKDIIEYQQIKNQDEEEQKVDDKIESYQAAEEYTAPPRPHTRKEKISPSVYL